MIIGTGSGRCGTMSLARLLDRQPGVQCTHERFKWRVPWDAASAQGQILHAEGRNDVAFYWLWCTEFFVQMGAQVICLKRPLMDTVSSYVEKTGRTNPWQDRGKKSVWDQCYPTYDAPLKRDAVRMYWHDYYDRARNLESIYPERFRVFDMDEALNTEAGQRDMLAFAGIDEPNITLNIHENTLLTSTT